MGTNIVLRASAAIAGAILMIVFSLAWIVIFLWMATSSVIGFAYWTALLGTYLNWLVTTLAAVFGTAADSPISAAGHSGRVWQETLVSAGFLLVAISIIGSSVLILWGLRTRALRGASYG
jgi:hydroxylaminobenzene mutase